MFEMNKSNKEQGYHVVFEMNKSDKEQGYLKPRLSYLSVENLREIVAFLSQIVYPEGSIPIMVGRQTSQP